MNKYILLFGFCIFLSSHIAIAQTEKISNKNMSNDTLNVSQQPSNVIPTATRIDNEPKNEKVVVETKTLNIRQQPSNVIPTATRIDSEAKNEKVVVKTKTLNVSHRPSGIAPTVTKVDAEKSDDKKETN